jgi:hypothetical protein
MSEALMYKAEKGD